MSESITFEKRQVDNQISEQTLIGAVGFTLSLTAFLMGVYSTALSTALTLDPTVFAVLRGLALLAMAATYFALYRFAHGRDALVRSRLAKTAAFALQALLPALCLLELLSNLRVPLVVVGFSWIAWGAASGYLTCSWIDGLSNVNEEKVGGINFASFLLAGIITAGVLSMSPLAIAVFYFAIILLAFLILMNAKKDAPPPPKRNPRTPSARNGCVRTSVLGKTALT